MNASIDLVTKRDIGETATMLTRSFDDSPLMIHCIPDDRRRPSVLRAFFRASIRDAFPFHNVFVARDGDRVLGAAVWLPPGRYPPSNCARSDS